MGYSPLILFDLIRDKYLISAKKGRNHSTARLQYLTNLSVSTDHRLLFLQQFKINLVNKEKLT